MILAILLYYYQIINSGNYDKNVLKDYAIVESQVAGLSVKDQQRVITVIDKESKFDPKRVHYNDGAKGCDSIGLVQIRNCNHDATFKQATNPIYSVNFLIKNIDKCETWWKNTCPVIDI